MMQCDYAMKQRAINGLVTIDNGKTWVTWVKTFPVTTSIVINLPTTTTRYLSLLLTCIV